MAVHKFSQTFLSAVTCLFFNFKWMEIIKNGWKKLDVLLVMSLEILADELRKSHKLTRDLSAAFRHGNTISKMLRLTIIADF